MRKALSGSSVAPYFELSLDTLSSKNRYLLTKNPCGEVQNQKGLRFGLPQRVLSNVLKSYEVHEIYIDVHSKLEVSCKNQRVRGGSFASGGSIATKQSW